MKENKKEKMQQEEKKSFVQKFDEIIRKKWLVKTANTFLLIAIVIALYIGVYILLDNVVLPEFDFTTEKVYSLSDETKDKLKDLNQEVKITLINFSESKTVINFVERYVELNNNIKIEKIDDLAARSDIMQKYSLEANDSLMIISSGNMEKTITTDDMYTYDYSTYEQIDTTEEAITNAIVNVTTGEKPKIYVISSNYTSFATITNALENEANEVEQLDILVKGEIPSDCDCLVITTLSKDFTEQEGEKILAYINNGGKLMLLCGPNISDISLTNFQAILDVYGVKIEKGVVFEGSTANMVSGYPDFIVEEAQSSSVTKNMNMNMNVCMIDAGKITLDESKKEELNVEYETVLATTEKAFLRTNLMQNSTSRTTEDSEAGQIVLAANVTKKLKDDKTSKLVIFSDDYFARDMQVQLNGYNVTTVSLYNNKDIILNSISYLCERENTITIRKQADNVTYTATEEQTTIIMAIIFILPLLIIIFGIVMWQIRRRKK